MIKEKITVFIALLILLGVPFKCIASQSSEKSKNVDFHLNTLFLGQGATEGGMDVSLGRFVSLGPAVLYYFNKSSDTPVISTLGMGYGARLGFYFSRNKISNGFKFSLNPYYVNIKVSKGIYSAPLAVFTGTALLGYQWFFWQSLNLDFMAGAVYTSAPQDLNLNSTTGTSINVTAPTPKGFYFYPEIDLGLAF